MFYKFKFFFVLSTLFIIGSSNPIFYEEEPSNELDEASLATLKFVAVITRHGSRTPLVTYPNDPYPYDNQLFWPSGPDELTYFGKQQMYLTGQQLRDRYKAFLPDLFHPNDTVAEYNNYNRDFMSGACLLASLYPPVGPAVWNQQLLWQPIPLKIRKFDVCALPYGDSCPAYITEVDKLLQKLDQTADSDNVVTELFKNVSLLTGTNVSTIAKLFDIYDVLHMQEENGFKLPAWAKQYYPEPIRSNAVPLLFTKYAASQTLLRLGAGPELKRISDMLTNVVFSNGEGDKKFYIEAAHDCTLLALLGAFGNLDPAFEVKTSAYMIFELHYLPEMHIIKILYYADSTVVKPMVVNIADCPTPCSYENFLKFTDKLSNLSQKTWQDQCAGNTTLNV